MNVVLSPKDGVKLTRWSVEPGDPLLGGNFNGRPLYFIYYGYASEPEPWHFWVDFQVVIIIFSALFLSSFSRKFTANT